MGYKMRKSSVLAAAKERLTKVESIDRNLVLADDLTVPIYRKAIETFSTKQDEYNGRLAELDRLGGELDNFEIDLRDKSERILAGIASRYGKDSPEYEQAGGVRKSERKRPTRTSKPE